LVYPLLAQKLASKSDKTIGKLLRSILTKLTGNWGTILVDQMPVDMGGNLKYRPKWDRAVIKLAIQVVR
jgi:hypothetical protein